MAVKKRRTKRGVAFDVRYKDEAGASRRETFYDEGQALKRDVAIRTAKLEGASIPPRREDDEHERGPLTLAQFADVYWREYATVELATNTRKTYSSVYNAHISPRLGHVRLADLDVRTIQQFKAEMVREKVPPASAAKALRFLGAMLSQAVAWDYMSANPAQAVKAPAPKRTRVIHPLAPDTVEQIRASLGQRDATLVAVMAYAGLRPGEALGLRWADVGTRLSVERAVAHGEIKPTKTGVVRTVRLLAPLRADLMGWKLACGNPADTRPVFPGHDGKPWSDSTFRNWRKRTFSKVAGDLGLTGLCPYDLRHSYASLRIHENRTPLPLLAREMGHSQMMLLAHYSHVMEDVEGGVDPEAAIRHARSRWHEGGIKAA